MDLPKYQNKHDATHMQSSRMYEQSIDSQFKQPYPPFEPFVGAPFNQLVPAFPVSQIHPISVPQYSLANQLWAVSPMHQVIISSNVATLADQGQNSVLIQNNVTLPPLSSNFNSKRENSLDRVQNQRFNKSGSYNVPPMNRKVQQINQNVDPTRVRDLRQILVHKRNLEDYLEENDIQSSQEYEPMHINNNCSRPKSRQGAELQEGHYQNNADTDHDWLEEHMNLLGAKLTLDVSNLKNLANAGTNTECWYIAADKDVYLNHLNFVNILCNSDDRCHLMLPRQVLSDLQAIVASSADSPRLVGRARRGVALFTQLLDADMAVVGEDPEECQDDFVLDCCLNLAYQNYHVVLISNDSTLKQKGNDTSVPTLTIEEVKQILSHPPKDFDNVKKSDAEPLPLIITVNNNLHQNTDVKNIQNVDSRARIDLEEFLLQDSSLLHNDMEADKENDNKNSCNSEAWLQDTETLDSSGFGTATPPSLQDHCDDTKDSRTDVWQCYGPNDRPSGLESTHQCNSRKKRLIRLNKAECQSNAASNTAGKRKYKWRKKKVPVKPDQCDSSTGTGEIIATHVQLKYRDMINDNADAEIAETNKVSMNIDEENMVSSEISSVPHGFETPGHNSIAFDEIFSSDVISNTSVEDVGKPLRSLISNLQGRQDSIESTVGLPSHQEATNSSEGVMFKVTCENTKNELKTQCDEWVSQFLPILEDVLGKVLQTVDPFRDGSMPPPWTIQGAADGINIKFHRKCEVVEMTDMLADILRRISHSKVPSEEQYDNTTTDTQNTEIAHAEFKQANKSHNSPRYVISSPSRNSSRCQSSEQDFTSNSPRIGYRNFDTQSLIGSSPDELEKKLNSHRSLTADVMDDILDYEDFADEAYYEYCAASENGNIEYENVQMEENEEAWNLLATPTHNKSESAKIDFDYIMQLVGITLLDVFTFYERSSNELRHRRMMSQFRMEQIQGKARECGAKTMDMCKILERILCRESCQLDKLEFTPDRHVIERCDRQARRIIQCLDEIINTTA